MYTRVPRLTSSVQRNPKFYSDQFIQQFCKRRVTEEYSFLRRNRKQSELIITLWKELNTSSSLRRYSSSFRESNPLICSWGSELEAPRRKYQQVHAAGLDLTRACLQSFWNTRQGIRTYEISHILLRLSSRHYSFFGIWDLLGPFSVYSSGKYLDGNLHRSLASPRRRRKGNPVPGGITGPQCFWGI
jgi:hypothetical protein